jgi:hypothetical protein
MRVDPALSKGLSLDASPVGQKPEDQVRDVECAKQERTPKR